MLPKIEEYVPSLTSAVELHALGISAAQYLGIESWSLRQIDTQGSVLSKPKFATALRFAITQLGATKAYAPQFCGWSAHLLLASQLSRHIKLRKEVLLIKPAEKQVVSGLFLEAGAVLLLNPDGDPLVIAQGGGFVAVARAGCGALVNPAAVRGKKRSHRKYPSVVNALVAEFGNRGIRPANMKAYLLFPRCGSTYRFEEKSYYRPLATYVAEHWPGAISIDGSGATILPDWIFTDQANKAGIPHVSCVDASTLLDHSHLLALKCNA